MPLCGWPGAPGCTQLGRNKGSWDRRCEGVDASVGVQSRIFFVQVAMGVAMRASSTTVSVCSVWIATCLHVLCSK